MPGRLARSTQAAAGTIPPAGAEAKAHGPRDRSEMAAGPETSPGTRALNRSRPGKMRVSAPRNGAAVPLSCGIDVEQAAGLGRWQRGCARGGSLLNEAWIRTYCGPAPAPEELWLRWNLDPVLLVALLLMTVVVARSRNRQGG